MHESWDHASVSTGKGSQQSRSTLNSDELKIKIEARVAIKPWAQLDGHKMKDTITEEQFNVPIVLTRKSLNIPISATSVLTESWWCRFETV